MFVVFHLFFEKMSSEGKTKSRNRSHCVNGGQMCNMKPQVSPKFPDKCSSVISVNTTPGKVPKSKVIQRDLIRRFYIPRRGPSHMTAFITPTKYEELKIEAHSDVKEMKEAYAKRKAEEKEKQREASKMRKAKMEELDLIRKQNIKLNDLEEEAKNKTEYLCQKANEIRQEQEEEIKEINELILCSKVQTIRNSQVAEKQLIKEEHKRREAELDQMMEANRQAGLRGEEEKSQRRKEEAYEAGALLQEQIKDNLERGILEKEKKNREGEEMRKHFKKLQLQEIEEMKQKKQKQMELLAAFEKDNEEMKQLSLLKDKQSRLEEYRLMLLQDEKLAKEEAAENEAKERKRLKELEIAKMREQQEQASDVQAEKDALRARRAQEQKEREYRRMEREKALKNKAIQEGLQKSRSEQLEMQNQLRFLKAEREQKEFQAMITKNRAEMESEELMRKMKRVENIKHADEIREQIKEKEREKINARKMFFQEGMHTLQEEEKRHARLEHIKRGKLHELENYDIPQTYVSHIHRKIQLPAEASLAENSKAEKQ